MLELNKVMLIGNLTRDPEVKYIASGTAIAQMSVAVNRRAGKGKEDEVAFIEVTAWDKTAEFCKSYLAKGKAIFVEGRLKMDTWDDKQTGQKRSKLSVVAERIQFADSRSGGAEGEGGSDDRSERTKHDGEARTATPAASQSRSAKNAEDDLPF